MKWKNKESSEKETLEFKGHKAKSLGNHQKHQKMNDGKIVAVHV